MIFLRLSKLMPLVPAVLGIMLIGGQIIFFGWIQQSLSDGFNHFMLFLPITWAAIRQGIRSIAFALNMTAIKALSAA